MTVPNEAIIQVFKQLYEQYTAHEIGEALKEYRLREGFWSPQEVKPKLTKPKKETNVKTTPTDQ
jgi:hypothetical protein